MHEDIMLQLIKQDANKNGRAFAPKIRMQATALNIPIEDVIRVIQRLIEKGKVCKDGKKWLVPM